jgi:hypothetical protein
MEFKDYEAAPGFRTLAFSVRIDQWLKAGGWWLETGNRQHGIQVRDSRESLQRLG